MTLQDELIKLHELQKVDTQIYQRQQTLIGLDTGETLKTHVIGLMKRHDAMKADLHKQEAGLRDRELELKSLEQKRATVHERLYSGRVTNPKELADMEKDEQMLDGQIGRVEEIVLELMDQVEAARTAESALGSEVDTQKRKYQEIVRHTTSETARLQQEIAALIPKRQQLASQIEKPLLRRYDDIRQHAEGVGMAATCSDTCPACHVKLTHQLISRLRAGEELTVCDNCGRILACIE